MADNKVNSAPTRKGDKIEGAIDPNRAYNIDDVATTLGVPTYQLRQAAARGELAVTQFGIKYFVTGQNLLNLLNKGNFKVREKSATRGGGRAGAGRPLAGAAAASKAAAAKNGGATNPTSNGVGTVSEVDNSPAVPAAA